MSILIIHGKTVVVLETLALDISTLLRWGILKRFLFHIMITKINHMYPTFSFAEPKPFSDFLCKKSENVVTSIVKCDEMVMVIIMNI